MRTTPLIYRCGWALLLTACQCLAQTQKDQMMSRREVTDIIATTRKIVSSNGVEELLSVQINDSTHWQCRFECRDYGNDNANRFENSFWAANTRQCDGAPRNRHYRKCQGSIRFMGAAGRLRTRISGRRA